MRALARGVAALLAAVLLWMPLTVAARPTVEQHEQTKRLYETVTMANGVVIGDPGFEKFLDARYFPLPSAAGATYRIVETSYSDYELVSSDRVLRYTRRFPLSETVHEYYLITETYRRVRTLHLQPLKVPVPPQAVTTAKSKAPVTTTRPPATTAPAATTTTVTAPTTTVTVPTGTTATAPTTAPASPENPEEGGGFSLPLIIAGLAAIAAIIVAAELFFRRKRHQNHI